VGMVWPGKARTRLPVVGQEFSFLPVEQGILVHLRRDPPRTMVPDAFGLGDLVEMEDVQGESARPTTGGTERSGLAAGFEDGRVGIADSVLTGNGEMTIGHTTDGRAERLEEDVRRDSKWCIR
jgi:hypothetical protein